MKSKEEVRARLIKEVQNFLTEEWKIEQNTCDSDEYAKLRVSAFVDKILDLKKGLD